MHIYKFKWTITESDTYEIAADSLEEAKKELLERNMPDEIIDQNIQLIVPVTNIEFTDTNGNESETQFDTQDEEELAQLWWLFCKENKLIGITKGDSDFNTGKMI